MNRQTHSTILAVMLSMALLLTPIPSLAQPAHRDTAGAPSATAFPETPQGLPGVSASWWAAVAAEIRQSEYQVTWQEPTYLADLAAGYQGPNRAHNLRTYFSPQGIRVIPRVFEGETPSWEWGLTLSGYGYADGVQPVTAASLYNDGNRIEYRRDDLAEWYINDARGLDQGFTLLSPPGAADPAVRSAIVLELAFRGELTAGLSGDGQAIELTTRDGVQVLHYGDLMVTDAVGHRLPAHLSLSPGGDHSTGQSKVLQGRGEGRIRLAFDATSARYPITIDSVITGLGATPAWAVEGNQDYAGLGISVGTAGDVNGDGYSDVVVGASSYDNGQGYVGRAYVYHGSATGLGTEPAWTADGEQAWSGFGTSVGTAGDVNGDGYSDVIVSAPDYSNDQDHEGRAYVYHGSAMGLGTEPAWTADGDQAWSGFGWWVGTAGDVNGDGYSDVIVGSPNYDNGQGNEGRACVYHGSAAGLGANPAWTAEGNQEDAQFGISVGTAGDVNGDGYSDTIVGANGYSNGQAYEGGAYVYHGSTTGLATDPAWIGESDQSNANSGFSVGTAGDVNGDGYSDVIVGAYQYDNGQWDEGRAYVYPGSATGLGAGPAWMAESDQEGAQFGYSVGTAGDVNGDGYSDVIVSADYYTSDQNAEGRVYAYHGSASGLGANPAWTADGGQADAHFGYSVRTAGDVNGDGYSDVIAGAPDYDNGQDGEGQACVYYGNGGDGLHLLPRQMQAYGSAPIAFLGISDSSTAFQLRLIGRMPLGRDDVRLQWQAAPLGAPITATGVISGASGWTDTLTTGVVISQDVTGLTRGMPYHWRVRLLYRPGNALGQPAGRWVHIPWAGWNETDLRTLVNEPPIADAGPDQAVDLLAPVMLDGRASADPDADLPLVYHWTQTSGPAVTLSDPAVVTPTFTAPSDRALLTFTLAVTDSLGLPDPTPDEVMIMVGNHPPVADAGPDQAVNTLALTTLDGSASADPDGDLPLTYLWVQTGGPAVTLSDPTVVTPTFTAPGDPTVLTFTLAVTDSLGLPDPTPDVVVITVEAYLTYLPLVVRNQ